MPLKPDGCTKDIPMAASEHGGLRIVCIGASAGGLGSILALVGAMPVPTGMAFVFVQHLSPDHDSLVVGLLAEHTALHVVEAVDGLRLEREHLYVIAPGTYISIQDGMLSVTKPPDRTPVRLPRRARGPTRRRLPSMYRWNGWPASL